MKSYLDKKFKKKLNKTKIGNFQMGSLCDPRDHDKIIHASDQKVRIKYQINRKQKKIYKPSIYCLIYIYNSLCY